MITIQHGDMVIMKQIASRTSFMSYRPLDLLFCRWNAAFQYCLRNICLLHLCYCADTKWYVL